MSVTWLSSLIVNRLEPVKRVMGQGMVSIMRQLESMAMRQPQIMTHQLAPMIARLLRRNLRLKGRRLKRPVRSDLNLET
jgi:hypothetical protein